MENIKNKCDLFAENYYTLLKAFKGENNYTLMACAFIYANRDEPVNIDNIDYCRSIIKNNTKLFSSFRGDLVLLSTVNMTFNDNPEEMLFRTKDIYEQMATGKVTEHKFIKGMHLVIAALTIASEKKDDYSQTIIKAENIYLDMVSRHRLLTNTSDYGHVALLANLDRDASDVSEEIERCYEALRDRVSINKDVLQAIACVLALDNTREAYEKASNVSQLMDAMAKHKLKTKGPELDILAFLALLGEDRDELANTVAQTYNYIADKKKFGKWSLHKSDRLLYAAAFTVSSCSNKMNGQLQVALINNIATILISQQISNIIIMTTAMN